MVLWSLFPGQHFKPLVNWALLLLFVHSTPLWWAIADAASRRAAGAGRTYAAGAIFRGVAEPLEAAAAGAVVGALAILLVPILHALVMFGTWRAIGGIWRA